MFDPCRSSPLLVLTVLATLGGASAAFADETPANRVLGVATCAGSSCHGAIEPAEGASVTQNEYLIWQSKDAHAQAYNVLLSPRSQRIASNLGLESAHTADTCLDCHSHNVEPAQRAGRFRLDDGVGCEACHGASENWLGPHVAGAADRQAHAELKAAGLYPTEDPRLRAELCLSCHLGNQDRFVTHRMYGAGHPRLSFELDTFTAIQPAHFTVDADYRRRKKTASHVRTWALGQAAAAEQLLRAMADDQHAQSAFPELAFFDCHACHHPMTNVRWTPRTGADPGRPRLRDTTLIMLQLATSRIAPEVEATLARQTAALHVASQQDSRALQSAAASLIPTARDAADRLDQHAFSSADADGVVEAVIEAARRGDLRDYSAAEQATMALAAVLADLREQQSVKAAKLQKTLDRCHEALASESDYRPEVFSAIIASLGSSVASRAIGRR